nr:questin oxidase family protein [Actinoplanes siamensis]
MGNDTLDEALLRLHRTGPEFDGWLSNHGPMATEALVRNGHADDVPRWVDGYLDRLEEVPRGIAPIAADQWRESLGDARRTGDWLVFFDRETRSAPWREVLARWWPRLLPGIAAGATHGVIRVGHAVRVLLEEETPARVAELGQGLAYWAARWQPIAPAGRGPYPSADPRHALDAVPRVPDQRAGVRDRLAQLADLSAWPQAAGAVPAENLPAADQLRAIVAAAARRHLDYGYGSPVMLVHATTAPAAVLRALPALPPALAAPSVAAAWAATAAITAAYSPATPDPAHSPDAGPRQAPTRSGSSNVGPGQAPIKPGSPGPGLRQAPTKPGSPGPWEARNAPGRPAGPSSSSDPDRDSAPALDPGEVFERAVFSGDEHAIKFADAAVESWRLNGDPVLLRAAVHATDLIGPV